MLVPASLVEFWTSLFIRAFSVLFSHASSNAGMFEMSLFIWALSRKSCNAGRLKADIPGMVLLYRHWIASQCNTSKMYSHVSCLGGRKYIRTLDYIFYSAYVFFFIHYMFLLRLSTLNWSIDSMNTIFIDQWDQWELCVKSVRTMREISENNRTMRENSENNRTMREIRCHTEQEKERND